MTTEVLKELTGAKLVEIYNELADTPVKKFKDKTTAVNRVHKLLRDSGLTVNNFGQVSPLVDPDHKVDPAKVEAAEETIKRLADEAAAEAKGRESNVVPLNAGTKSKRAEAAEAATPSPKPAPGKQVRTKVTDDTVLEQTGDISRIPAGIGQDFVALFDGKRTVRQTFDWVVKNWQDKIRSKLFKEDPDAYLFDYAKWSANRGALAVVEKKVKKA